MDGQKHIVQCVECKKQLVDPIQSIKLMLEKEEKNKISWFNTHIFMIRDNPELRLQINLSCLFGMCFWCFIIYLHYFQLVNIESTFTPSNY